MAKGYGSGKAKGGGCSPRGFEEGFVDTGRGYQPGKAPAKSPYSENGFPTGFDDHTLEKPSQSNDRES